MRWLACWVLVVACGDDAVPPDAGTDAPVVDAPRDVALDVATPDAVDAFVPPLCADPAAFQAGTGFEYGEVAGDFTVETLSGTWRFSEQFSGCESYVFVNYAPGVGDAVWNSPPPCHMKGYQVKF